MTTERQIAANRQNCRSSTGPKTAMGRVRPARNSFRHGLSLAVHYDPSLSQQVQALAREISGPGASTETQELARRVAEAQIDLRRVRYARHNLLSKALNDSHYDSEVRTRQKDKLVVRCARTAGPLSRMPIDVAEFLNSKPEGPQKFAAILSDKARQLDALDRYERRALSRRKFAVRAFAAHVDR